MVDGDHSGGSYSGFDASMYTAEQVQMMSDQQAQQYFVLPESPDGRTVGYNGAGSGWVCRPPYADGGGSVAGRGPSVSGMEFYVTPFDNLVYNNPSMSVVSPLVAGKIIGFQISVPDFDAGAGQYHGYYALSGQPNTWRLAENFVDGQLLAWTDKPGVVPRPYFRLSSTTLVFDRTEPGTYEKTLSITNAGKADLVVSSITVSGPAAAEFQVSPPTFTVPPAGTQTVTVTFTRAAAVGRSASLSINHNAPGGPAAVELSALGQVVNVTVGTATGGRQSTVTVPISVDNAQGIAGGDLTVTYDSRILTAKTVQAAELLTNASVTVVPNLGNTGIVKVSMAGFEGLKGGKGVLVNVGFEVASNAPKGTTPLGLQSGLVDENGASIRTVNTAGYVTVMVGVIGDVNDDKQVNSGDAVLVLRHSAGLTRLSDAQKDMADVNGDHQANSGDAVLILRYSAGLIKAFPRAAKWPVVGPAAGLVTLGSTWKRLSGGEVEVPVEVGEGVAAGDLLLSLEGPGYQVVGVEASAGAVIAANATGPVQLRVSFARTAVAGGRLLTLRLVGAGTAPAIALSGQLYGLDGEMLAGWDKSSRGPCRPALTGCPNPFNPATTLTYELAADGPVELVVHSTTGSVVRHLVSDWRAAGAYSAVWDGRDDTGAAVAAGLYLARLHHGGGVHTLKLMLLK